MFIHVLAFTSAHALVLRARLRFDKHNSDLLTDVQAYNECMRLRSDDESRGSLRSFCEEVSITLPVDTEKKRFRVLTEFHLHGCHSRDNFAPPGFLFLVVGHGVDSALVYARFPEPQYQ